MYEFAVMVSITLLGFRGVSWWTVVAAAALLSLPSLFSLEIARDRLRSGLRELFVMSGIYSLFAIVCFAGGQGIASLMRAG